MNMKSEQSFYSYFYGNFPKFSDRQVWANSVDPDQTALGAVWSGSTLFAIPSASFGCIIPRKSHLVKLLGWLQQIFGCPKFHDFYGNFVSGGGRGAQSSRQLAIVNVFQLVTLDADHRHTGAWIYGPILYHHSYCLSHCHCIPRATDKVGIWWKLRDNFPYFYKNICCGYSLESPRWGNSNEYPQHMFLWRTDKNYFLIIIKYPPYLFHWFPLTGVWHAWGRLAA